MNKIKGTLKSENNPKWPPTYDDAIIVQKNGVIYPGKVKKNLSDSLVIISLVRGYSFPHSQHSNKNIIPHLSKSSNPKHFIIVSKNDGWTYTSEKKLREYLYDELEFYSDNELDRREELLYDIAQPGVLNESTEGYPSGSNNLKITTTTKPTLQNQYYFEATSDPEINVQLKQIIDDQDMDDFAFLSRSKTSIKSSIESDENPISESYDDLKIDVQVQNPEEVDDCIDYEIKNVRKIILDRLDGNDDRNTNDDGNTNGNSNGNDKDNNDNNIIEKLNRNQKTPQDILIVDQTMIFSFVNNRKALSKEAEKIKDFLSRAFYLSGDSTEQNEEKIYGNLRFIYYNGYVHILRTDIPLKEVITHELLGDTPENPKLKILGEQEYGIPIRHNVLKYVLFQNELQQSLSVDRQLLAETELILSQEYIIALTPEPRYQIWCVTRLVKLWYGDIDLQNNIRKIKLIVNQYRTRSNQKYNIRNGIRFSIGVYPRYGKKSATIIVRKLMYYFSLYFQAIGWKNNPPSYFKIINDLISYTNCSQSLKLYYRKIASMNNQKKNSFNENYTLINNSKHNTDILQQYVQL
jgi:hypothetical protein